MRANQHSPTGASKVLREPIHLKRWTRPNCYMGAEWAQWFVFLGRNRDSDDLTNSNFDCGLAAVKAVANKELSCDKDEMASIQVVSENHWLCGWVEWIAIHEFDTAALECADKLMKRLDNYPVLNEEDWSRRESEHADSVWKDCYNVGERVEYIRKHSSQFEFRSFADMMGCVRGKYFGGYASELIQ